MPPIHITQLRKNDKVHAFHRYSQDPNGYFMVKYKTMGSLHPCLGKTDGWTEAVVTENWDISKYDIGYFETWPEIRWTYPLWYDRHGNRLDVSKPQLVTQRILPEQIRLDNDPKEALGQPVASFIFIREND